MRIRLTAKALLLFGFLVLMPVAALAQDSEAVSDPIQGVNRGIFWFNDQFDVNLAEPVARGYDYVTPDSVQHSIKNFFNNLQYPAFLLADLVQLKFGQAASDTGRFVINTTAGLVGFFDVAKEVGLERHREDFGVALAYWGVPSGPYIVIPILGPSNVRDAVGLVVDSFADPLYWLGTYTNLTSTEVWLTAAGAKTVEFTNIRAGLLDAIKGAKEGSLDYYLFMQSAYDQYRAGIINKALTGESGASLDDDFLKSGSSLDDDLDVK